MFINVIENNKDRTFSIDRGYTYQERIRSGSSDYIEFFTMVKDNDYSFFYANFTGKEKVGTFTIEKDSIFNEAFLSLVSDGPVKIKDDYTDRYMSIYNIDGSVNIEFHLLEGEQMGSVELKNIMYDTRSDIDIENPELKVKLSKFFDKLTLVEKEKINKKVRRTLNGKI